MVGAGHRTSAGIPISWIALREAAVRIGAADLVGFTHAARVCGARLVA